jgi:Rha family phage regulatory protein
MGIAMVAGDFLMSQEIQFCSGANGEALVSSREVALKFKKEHRAVLRSYKNIVSHSGQQEFNARNFTHVEYKDNKGESREEIMMTKNGFVLLAMGFTGEEAMRWKIKFIDAFDGLVGRVEDLRKELFMKEKMIADLQEKSKRKRRASHMLVPQAQPCFDIEGHLPELKLIPVPIADLTPTQVVEARFRHKLSTMRGLAASIGLQAVFDLFCNDVRMALGR